MIDINFYLYEKLYLFKFIRVLSSMKIKYSCLYKTKLSVRVIRQCFKNHARTVWETGLPRVRNYKFVQNKQ